MCTQTFREDDIVEQLIKLNGIIEADAPNNNIYVLDGFIHFPNINEKIHFNINNVLLRGGTLMNVDYVYVVVIYTGKNTKIMNNK